MAFARNRRRTEEGMTHSRYMLNDVADEKINDEGNTIDAHTQPEDPRRSARLCRDADLGRWIDRGTEALNGRLLGIERTLGLPSPTTSTPR